MRHRLFFPRPRLSGEVDLAGSKSISNRALIIRALCDEGFAIRGLADAKDTRLLRQLLASEAETLDAGAAGTTYRFLTAFLAMQDRPRVLTGSARMKERPIGLLVDALRQLGARIDYLEREGYPPLRIHPRARPADVAPIKMPAGTSSQYISALLMIGPTLPRGLQLELVGDVVSRPYIEMTLRIMGHFGVAGHWRDQVISIPPQPYRPRPFTVEADWSAASYFYALAAIARRADIHLNGLFADSLQGDAVLVDMMRPFGIESRFEKGGVRLRKEKTAWPRSFVWDFLQCPDLAQTLAVTCAASGVEGRFTGLQTLRIKETDRIDALRRELAKVGVRMDSVEAPPGKEDGREWFGTEGKALVSGSPRFATYEDHRMAMALAPLALLGPIEVEEPMVVEKSYPDFWKDLQRLGCQVEDVR